MIVAFLLAATVCRAGLYSREETCPFVINDDGTAQPLPVEGSKPNSFPLHFSYYGNLGDPRDRKENLDRPPVLAKLAGKLPDNADDQQLADFSAGLIRTSQFQRAEELLTPKVRSRRPDYRLFAHYLHLLASERRWAQAYDDHLLLDDLSPPESLGKTTPAQLAWLKKVESQWYRRWLKLHAETAKTPPNQETVLPLFEKDKPKDAIAIVQQLLLWAPWDSRLYWLLAKLYWENGHLRPAKAMYDGLISEERGYGNRTLLRKEYSEILDAVKALPPENEDTLDLVAEQKPASAAEKPAWIDNLSAGPFIVAGVLIALLLAYQIRVAIKRSRR